MNNYLCILVGGIFCILVGALGVFIIRLHKADLNTGRVSVHVADHCVIPRGVTHVGLLGCTPHPTNYLKNNPEGINGLADITIGDLLDVPYVYDSFVRTFTACKQHTIEHLIIAYLPVYYVGMRALCKDRFVSSIKTFLTAIIEDMRSLITKAAHVTNYQGSIVLLLPPSYQLDRVPMEITSLDERCRYLVKQFPKIQNIAESSLAKIIIINNRESPEDDALINYFKYQYLFKKAISFDTVHINKERFHKYKE